MINIWFQGGQDSTKRSDLTWGSRVWKKGNHDNIDDLVQNCSISIANALDILQSSTKPSLSHFTTETSQLVRYVLANKGLLQKRRNSIEITVCPKDYAIGSCLVVNLELAALTHTLQVYVSRTGATEAILKNMGKTPWIGSALIIIPK